MSTRSLSREIISGALAGLAGTAALLAMRGFDRRYAPRTIADGKQKSTGAELGLGALGGAMLGLRGKFRRTTAVHGAMMGAVGYLLGRLGWFSLLKGEEPKFPEIVGGAMRHAAQGAATAAVYGVMHGREDAG